MQHAQRNGRALVLVALAISAGVVILGLGFDGSTGLGGPSQGTQEPQGTPTPATTPTPAPSPTAVPQPSLAPASTVRVLVANATDIAGSAATATDTLIATFGYNALPPTNTTGDPNVLSSAVYHVPEHAGDAQQIAAALGIDPSAIASMPTDPPVADLADAGVLVVIGADRVAPPPDEEPE